MTPKRAIRERALGWPPPERANVVTTTSPRTNTTADDGATGHAAHVEQRDVEQTSIVAACRQGHQRGGGGSTSDGVPCHCRTFGPRTKAEQASDPDGQGYEAQEANGSGRELNEHRCRGGAAERHHGQEADDLTQSNAVVVGLGAGDGSRRVTNVLSMFVLTKATAAIPASAARPALRRRGSGIAGP